MRVGILEFTVPEANPNLGTRWLYRTAFRHFASIMPQAIAVWCRQMGHDVFYATYWGQQQPHTLIPDDLDVLFISTATSSSCLAYGVAKAVRIANNKTLLVAGGPHAKCYSEDSLRFFDLVVTSCNKGTIKSILDGHYDAGATVSESFRPQELPLLEERSDDIVVAHDPHKTGDRAFIGVLASFGCPYDCNFCTDWDSTYSVRTADSVAQDVAYVARTWPKARVAFHDPNFAIRFTETMEALESIPKQFRAPYDMEASLTTLRQDRLQRLTATHCERVAPGIESWTDYSRKAGVGSQTGNAKLEKVVDHLHELSEHIDVVHANLIFGLDCDEGREPVELTKEFFSRTRHASHFLNIPVAYKTTPLYDDMFADGRILPIPYAFHNSQYNLSFIPKNYAPVEYLDLLLEQIKHYVSGREVRAILRQAYAEKWNRQQRVQKMAFSMLFVSRIKQLRQLRDLMQHDEHMNDFHEGRRQDLPPYYTGALDALLGDYAPLLSAEERLPLN